MASWRPATWQECLDDLGSRLRDSHRQLWTRSPSAFSSASGLGMDGPPGTGWRRLCNAGHRERGGPGEIPADDHIDGTAKVLISDLLGGSMRCVRTPRLRHRRVSSS